MRQGGHPVIELQLSRSRKRLFQLQRGLVSSMLKLSSLKPSKYTRWILASIGRLVTGSPFRLVVGHTRLSS